MNITDINFQKNSLTYYNNLKLFKKYLSFYEHNFKTFGIKI